MKTFLIKNDDDDNNNTESTLGNTSSSSSVNCDYFDNILRVAE